MASNLEDLGKICLDAKKVPGLISKIKMVAECDIDALPAANTYDHATYDSADDTTFPHVISSDITLTAPAAWKTLNFRDGSDANYVCVVEGEEDAEEHVVTITFFRPTLDRFTSWLIDEAMRERLIVQFWDKGLESDYPRIGGEKNNGMRLTYQEQTRPKNGYMFTLTCRMRKSPYWYTGS